MNVASDHLRERTNLGSLKRILREQRWLGMSFVQIFTNRQRLNQDGTVVSFERGHEALRM